MYELAKRMWDYWHNALKTEGSDEKLPNRLKPALLTSDGYASELWQSPA